MRKPASGPSAIPQAMMMAVPARSGIVTPQINWAHTVMAHIMAIRTISLAFGLRRSKTMKNGAIVRNKMIRLIIM